MITQPMINGERYNSQLERKVFKCDKKCIVKKIIKEGKCSFLYKFTIIRTVKFYDNIIL